MLFNWNDHLHRDISKIFQKNGRWQQRSSRGKGPVIPVVLVLADKKHIKLYHDLLQTYRVEIIHYDLEKGLKFPDVLFESARVVKFETTTISIGTEHDVYKKDFVKSEAYRNVPDVIIQKALDRIGERKWTWTGKWSSNLAAECVIVDLDKYYTRGYRLASAVHAQCFDLLYAHTLRSCQDSGLERISFIMKFLMK